MITLRGLFSKLVKSNIITPNSWNSSLLRFQMKKQILALSVQNPNRHFSGERPSVKDRLQLIQKELQKNPADWKLHHELAQLHVQEADHFSAVQHLKKAAEINPHPDLFKQIGQLSEMQGTLVDALLFFKGIAQRRPTDSQLLEMIAYILSKQNQHSEAIQYYLKALESNPKPQTIYNLALSFLHKEDLVSALEYFKKSLELQPHNEEAHAYSASILIKDKPEEARVHLEHILKLNPKAGYAFMRLGMVNDHEDNAEEALKNYQKALEFLPNNGQLHYHIGSALFRLKRYEEAVSNYEKCLKLDPKYSADANVRQELAISYNAIGIREGKEGNFTKSLDFLKKARHFEPRNEGISYNIGLVYLENHQYNEALSEFQALLQKNPIHPDALNASGFAYHKLGNDSKAMVEFRKALTIQPKHGAAYVNYQKLKHLENKPGVMEPPEYEEEIADDKIAISAHDWELLEKHMEEESKFLKRSPPPPTDVKDTNKE